jgi:hypothetical protein
MKIEDLKAGESYILISNKRSVAGVTLNRPVKIYSVDSANNRVYVNGGNAYVDISDLGDPVTDMKRFELELEDLQAKAVVIQSKIAYLKENSLEKFDEKEWKCYQALLIAEDTSKSQIERARALAELIK